MKSILSATGQVTLPPAVRRALGVRPGSAVEIELRPEGALLRKSGASVDPIDQAYGILKRHLPAGTRVDDLMNRLRGPAWPPAAADTRPDRNGRQKSRNTNRKNANRR